MSTLVGVSSALMAVYLVDISIGYLTFWPSLVLKWFPVALLALAVLSSKGSKNPLFPKYQQWIGFGLAFGSIGDIFMDLQNLDQAYFLPGLGSFLVGHVLYIVAFAVGNPTISMMGVPFFLAGGAMFAILLPTLPSDFVVPVIVYIVVIAAMVTKSLSRPTKRFASVGIYLALAGAVFFMISDSALSFNLFQKKFEGARLLVMTTYYAAQVLIALSAVDSVSGGLTKGAE